jgi:hypothetical protein
VTIFTVKEGTVSATTPLDCFTDRRLLGVLTLLLSDAKGV